jgi:PhzF family phenazine biosynthesis protein
MRVPFFQVDAFARRPFEGNPAAVCPLERWLPERVMQAIAAENNLSETAFFVPREDGDFDLRWFTPNVEVDLCGHATLASAFVVFHRLRTDALHVRFHTRSGPLEVAREDELYALDLPARPPEPCAARADLEQALGAPVAEALRAGTFLLAVLEREQDVARLAPDPARVAALDADALIATAPGREVDFVSRFFAPRFGIPEDPVTGAAHCTLVPYWSRRLGRKSLRARQISARGGELDCTDRGARVSLAGRAALVIEGTLLLGALADGERRP